MTFRAFFHFIFDARLNLHIRIGTELENLENHKLTFLLSKSIKVKIRVNFKTPQFSKNFNTDIKIKFHTHTPMPNPIEKGHGNQGLKNQKL